MKRPTTPAEPIDPTDADADDTAPADAKRRPTTAWSYKIEAESLGISESSLMRLVQRHEIPILEAGSRKLFDEVAHDRLIEAMRKPVAKRPAAPGGFRSSASSGKRAVDDDAYYRVLAMTSKGSRLIKAPRGKR